MRWREEIPGKPKVVSWFTGARLEAKEAGAISSSCDKVRRGEVDVMCYYVTGEMYMLIVSLFLAGRPGTGGGCKCIRGWEAQAMYRE